MPLLWLFPQWGKASLRVKSCESLRLTLFFNDSCLRLAQGKEEEPHGYWHALPPCASRLKGQREYEFVMIWKWQILLCLWWGVHQRSDRKSKSSHNCLATHTSLLLLLTQSLVRAGMCVGSMVGWLLSSAPWSGCVTPGTHTGSPLWAPLSS